MKKKAPPPSPLAAVAMAAAAVVAVAWSTSGLPRASATIQSTCAAAAARDVRVDPLFCARQFLAYPGAAEADPWALARTAALIGAGLGDDAVYDLREGATIDAPPRAMDACVDAYDGVGRAFAEAADEVAARRYAAARDRFGRVAPLVRSCGAAVAAAVGGGGAAGGRTPPDLARYGDECLKMAVIGAAITGLIG